MAPAKARGSLEDGTRRRVVIVTAGDDQDPHRVFRDRRPTRVGRQGHFSGGGPFDAAQEGRTKSGFPHRRCFMSEGSVETAALAVIGDDEHGFRVARPARSGALNAVAMTRASGTTVMPW